MGVLTASCAALTNSGVSTEVSPPDVARTATTPLAILLEPGEREIKRKRRELFDTIRGRCGWLQKQGARGGSTKLYALTALDDGAGAGAATGQRGDAERRGDAAGGDGHGYGARARHVRGG
jgi:hypothetical protein